MDTERGPPSAAFPCLALAGSSHEERVEALSWAVRLLPTAGPSSARRRRALLDLSTISALFEREESA